MTRKAVSFISFAMLLIVMVLLPTKAPPTHWSDLLFLIVGFLFFLLRAIEEKNKDAWVDMCCVGALLLEDIALLFLF